MEAAFFVIEQAGEDTWRIEVGKTHEVDGAIETRKCYRVEIAYDTVIFYGLITHGQ